MILTNADDDFLKSFNDGGATPTEPTQPTEPVEQTQTVDVPVTDTVQTPENENVTEVTDTTDLTDVTDPSDVTDTPGTASQVEGGDPAKAVQPEKPTDKTTAPEDFRAQALAPLRAAGRDVQIQSIEELRQLAQKGIDYTRKTSALAASRKYTTMLERAGLLDEDKLTFLIDLNAKNPQAIAKFLKDSQIDPLDIDTRSEPAYVAGDHKVSDQEITVRSTIEDIVSRDGGQEVIDLISNTWDKQSQAEVVNDPNGLEVVYQHKQSGVYDRVVDFVEHQRLVNNIPASMPFIQAYVQAFQVMAQAGQFADIQAKVDAGVHNATSQPAQVREPVATRTATPKPKVTNGAAANAASVSQPTRAQVTTPTDLASMSDEAFMKAMTQSR